MSRPRLRVSAFAGVAFGITIALSGCKKQVNATSDAASPSAGDPTAAHAEAAAPKPRGPIERIHILASIEGLDDMFAAADALAARTIPEQNLNTKAQIQALLIGTGFGPAFLDNLDLNAVHAAALDYPHEGQQTTLADSDFAARVATRDSRRVIDAMPAAVRPQPLGSGLWEMTGEEPRVLLRETPTAILFGLDSPDLERASGLADEVGRGRRIRTRATNLPKDDVDPARALGIDADNPIVSILGSVVRQISGAGLEIDFGTGRDLELVTFVEAPFGEVDLSSLGPARTEATSLERRLPPRPVAAMTWSMGDPALAHEFLRQPMEADDAALEELLARALEGTHGLLDQLQDDFVLAAYLGPKGKLALVMSGGVKHEERARNVLRSLHEVVADAAAKAARERAGADGGEKSPPPKVKVTFKPDGLGFSGQRADRLTVQFPKDLFDEPRAELIIEKNRLEIITLVQDGVATVAMGAGAKRIIADIARHQGKKRGQSLGSEPGLAAARSSLGGCQLCFAVRPTDLLRMALKVEQLDRDTNAARKKELATGLAKLQKKVDGDAFASGGGARVAPTRAELGWVLPKTALAASPETWALLKELVDSLDDDGPPAAPKG